ncbi:MAG: serine/threonine protein kinase [Deltaproteobacteria bacterium]|nr:serine/threonine protein kinase [Deltaproteobacteria bacterium]
MKLCPQCLTRLDQGDLCPADGQRLLSIDGETDPRIGAVVHDRFVILGLLGRGGMGTIYRAYQRSIGREVALKILAGRELADAEFVERFSREARHAGELRSPYTITVHDFGRLETGELYIAMERVHGRTLEEALRAEGAFSLERVLVIAGQIAASLEEAHGRGVVHRDLKPANVMLIAEGSADERIKVLDFGLAKLVTEESGPTLTRAGFIYGTPAYMAPELWSEDLGPVSPATDVYAFGALAFELATDQRAFAAKSTPGFMHKHLYDPAPSLTRALTARDEHAAQSTLAVALEAIIRRCLEKKPADRFASGGLLRAACVAALDAARVSTPVAEPEPGPTFVRSPAPAPVLAPVLAPVPVERGRWAWMGLLAGLAGLAALGGLLWSVLAPNGDPGPSRARDPDPAPQAQVSMSTTVAALAPPAPRPSGDVTPAAPRAPSRPKRKVEVLGPLGREAAERAIGSIEGGLDRCAARAPGVETLYLIVAPDGGVQSAEVRPEGSSARAFEACLGPAALALRLPPFDGASFATVRVGLHR